MLALQQALLRVIILAGFLSKVWAAICSPCSVKVFEILEQGNFGAYLLELLRAQFVAAGVADDVDDGVRALGTEDFRVMSVNAPWIVGTLPGLTIGLFDALTRYAHGTLVPGPAFLPAGGVNFMSARSLSGAVVGALARGRPGAAYLVGDENLSFEEFFGHFFRAAGREVPPVRDQEHPLLTDSTLYFGRGNTLYYEPDAAETALLGYRRGDVGQALREIVAQYGPGTAGR